MENKKLLLPDTETSITFAIVVFSFLFLSVVEFYLQGYKSSELFDQFFFQSWSSDTMMQTVKMSEIRKLGLTSFIYIHIQPPMFDFVRYLLSWEIDFSDENYIRILDHRIYIFYCALYGAFNGLIFNFGRRIGLNITLSAIISIFWMLSPANLSMATLLDSTYLSSFFITASIYYLVSYLRSANVNDLILFIFFVALCSLTRTVFQFYFIPVLYYYVYHCFKFYNKSAGIVKQIFCYLLISTFIILPIKQKILFGTFFTTSYAGQHKVEGIWYYPEKQELEAIQVPEAILNNGAVLENKWNSRQQLSTNYRYEHLFNRLVLEKPRLVIGGVIKSAKQGIKNIWKPTQDYSENKLIDFLPWTNYFHQISGGVVYMGLFFIAFSGFIYACNVGLIEVSANLAFLIFYISSILTVIVVGTNRYIWTEIDRLKFLIEPTFLVLSVCGITVLGSAAIKRMQDIFGVSRPT